MIPNDVAAVIRQVVGPLKQAVEKLVADVQSLQSGGGKAKSPEEYINAIPGRRIFYTLVGTQTFTTTQNGVRGNPINMLVSQDGPFIMTGYPIAMWRSDLPTNATDFGRWRPVYSWPLPTQQLTTNFIDISYELIDSGAQRNFQNLAVPPLLSRPDQLLPLPVPTLFAPNSVVQFVPTYQAITFGGSQATTEGTLVIGCPGYRIVNL